MLTKVCRWIISWTAWSYPALLRFILILSSNSVKETGKSIRFRNESTGWTLRGSNPSKGKRWSLLRNVQTVTGATQPLIQCVSGFFRGVRRFGSGFDHLPPSSTEVNVVWSYISALPIRPHGVDGDIFVLTIYVEIKQQSEHVKTLTTARYRMLP